MADSTPARQTQAPSAQQQNQDLPPTSKQTPPTAATHPLPPVAPTSTGKRPRGRPCGSKNKSQSPVYVTEEKSTIGRIQLQIPAGSDIVATLESFARQHQAGIHVEGGYGKVTNITFWPNEDPIPGVFNLVSLAGTFLDPYKYNGSIDGAFPFYPGKVVPWLKMILSAGHTWRISRACEVAGAVTATDVLVNIMTFRNLEVQRLDPSIFGFQEPAYPLAPAMSALNYGGGEASGSGSGGGAQIGGEMPAPGFGPPVGEQQNYAPSGGVSAFRPPNCPN